MAYFITKEGIQAELAYGDYSFGDPNRIPLYNPDSDSAMKISNQLYWFYRNLRERKGEL